MEEPMAPWPGLEAAPLHQGHSSPPSDYPQAPEKSSIHRLMEAFMLGLQAQFPSTVSTVYRCVCGSGSRRRGG